MKHSKATLRARPKSASRPPSARSTGLQPAHVRRHFTRAFEIQLADRLQEPSQFIQAVLGPRQVGKTSGVIHVLNSQFSEQDYAYHSCDDAPLEVGWLQREFQNARLTGKKIIVFDEIQKLDRWSEQLKAAWDLQKRKNSPLHVVILGSSSLKLTAGLSESLAGRFEVISVPHWHFDESQQGFGMNWREYLKIGGYPGSYSLRKDSARFRNYMAESILEAVVSQDILRHSSVRKPALFRQTFALACQFPAQEVSYNKLLGQLQEAGNVDQIKHYLDLFSQAFLLRLIFKWSSSPVSRTSSPKLLPAAPVFTSHFLRRDLTPEEQGRVFESVVGNRLCETFESVHFWREGNLEVDFVVETENGLIGVEVKSKHRKTDGTQALKNLRKGTRICYVDFSSFPAFEKDPVGFLEEFSS